MVCFWWHKAAIRALLASFCRLLRAQSGAHSGFPNSFRAYIPGNSLAAGRIGIRRSGLRPIPPVLSAPESPSKRRGGPLTLDAAACPRPSTAPNNRPLKRGGSPRVYLLKVLPGVEQGWPNALGDAPSPVHLYEFIGVWVSAEHLNSLCVRPWVLGVLHTPSDRVVPIQLGASFHA